MEYEPLQPYFLLAIIDAAKCKTFADIGSNIGAYSILMTQAPSVEKFVAFEANPSAALEMQENFRLNSLDIDVQTVAVSDKSGFLSFGVVSRLAGNSAVVATAANQKFHHVDQVKCTTLDEALKGCSGPFALKIDVEGHEKEVLSGAGSLLVHPCIIQAENYGEEIKLPDGYEKIAQIGPDWYFSNVPNLSAADLFEQAAATMIEANHERKSASLHVGDLGLSVSGTTYDFIKRIALKFFRSRL